MSRRLIVVLTSLVALSCKQKPATGFPYLKPGMNEAAKISSAELRALQFSNAAGGARAFGLVIGEVSYPSFRADRTSVRFGENQVFLDIQVEVAAKEAQKWVEGSTEQQRNEVIEEKLCRPFLIELAKQLECDPARIVVSWSSSNAEVRGTMSGSNVPAK